MLPLAAASPHHFRLGTQSQWPRPTHPNTRHSTAKALPQAARTRAGVAATDRPLGQRPAAGGAKAAGATPYGEEEISSEGGASGAGRAQGRGARTGAGAAPVGGWRRAAGGGGERRGRRPAARCLVQGRGRAVSEEGHARAAFVNRQNMLGSAVIHFLMTLTSIG